MVAVWVAAITARATDSATPTPTSAQLVRRAFLARFGLLGTIRKVPKSDGGPRLGAGPGLGSLSALANIPLLVALVPAALYSTHPTQLAHTTLAGSLVEGRLQPASCGLLSCDDSAAARDGPLLTAIQPRLPLVMRRTRERERR